MKDRYCEKCGVTAHEQTGDAQGYYEFSCSECFTVHYVLHTPVRCEKAPNGSHQCDCPTGELVRKCQYCGEVME